MNAGKKLDSLFSLFVVCTIPSLNSGMVCIWHNLCTRVKAGRLPKSWISAPELTLLGKLNSLVCTLLLHTIGNENKNCEKEHLINVFKPHESRTQKSDHVDK